MAGEGVIPKIMSGVGSTFGSLFSGRLLPLGFGAIIIVILTFSAIANSVTERSIEPFINDGLKRIVLADKSIDENIDVLRADGGITNSFMAYFRIFAELYLVFLFIYLLITYISPYFTNNDSASIGNFLVGAGMFIFIFFILNLIFISDNLVGMSSTQKLVEAFPLKGTIRLFHPDNISLLLNPLQDAAHVVRPTPTDSISFT